MFDSQSVRHRHRCAMAASVHTIAVAGDDARIRLAAMARQAILGIAAKLRT
ncbi:MULTISPECIES: hypothetical protein [unclassified Lysobacter]|uniref:hypothetical protein n=1 Tax=unclassified Lysobacter TaxID=2635362 RepID=UPI001BE5C8CB|nr:MULTISPECIES: hypothetical protein [unclassified Lysobacter]MBT2748454.1 hypothetical protein [Lysobacter sp. ISL-42]MBT2752616.1 hypothetical protein [Lysobacter sp. ISL-50]MBT2776655.1 hypothetical protein [Lysobacter sp. ISL-54]MBT2782526.1 hypothetical protein [Lysobacter sp. ISL-52]